MSRNAPPKKDPLEREIVQALCPGEFISDRACFSFTNDLDEVAAKLANLTVADPTRAVSLYHTFIGGCYEKADEVDDSSGSFGQSVADLFCGWIAVRQAAGADPDDTAARLLAWMEDDPYGFCYRLEEKAAAVFDKAGLDALVKQIRARFDGETAKPASGRCPPQARRRWGDALRALYLAQKNVAAYIALAEETGPTAEDCHAVATLLVARGKPGEALSWVERGLEIDGKSRFPRADHDLSLLKRKILVKIGRGDEALDAAWTEYRRHPSKYSYDELMKFVPKSERAKWHERAMAEAQGEDVASIVELLLETKELDRLSNFVRGTEDAALEGVSHYTTAPAARKVEKAHPESAARLWLAQGMRILTAKKSKYYDAAVGNFRSAKRCFEKAGLHGEWENVVIRVRADHHRKKGFMAGFEDLVSGSKPRKEPSFLERAKAGWGRRQSGDDR